MRENERNQQELSRRSFHRLTAAAFGGVLSGTLTGCGNQSATGPADTQAASKADAGSATKGATTAGATPVAHACRGLNECKGQGKDHKNACAGQGTCFTVTHDCAAQNDCNSQGGCGGTNGFNDCKGKGGCGHFPIQDKVTWKKARERFEARMKVASKKVGPAPAEAG
jgi:hypothetical protein